MITSVRGPRAAPLLLIVFIGACARRTEKAAPEASRPASSSSTPVAAESKNSELARAVEHELQRDPHLAAAGIRVSAINGLVELSGQVDNVVSKERATRVAEVVRGVETVGNRIDVVPPARGDSELSADVRKALRFNAATADMPIQVSARNGVVRLTGSIGSWQEQQLAERIADGVRGVRFCQNDLTTKGAPARTSQMIANDVQSRLAWDALVEHDPIRVTVEGKHVSLSGTTGSAAERLRAMNDAWVAGVTGVDIDQLKVDTSARPDPNLRSSAAKPDREIAQAIKAAAVYDPRVRSFSVDPRVADGVATLTGTVATLAAKMAAESLARNTVGVRSVKNELSVRSPRLTSDQFLQNRVSEALLLDPMIDARKIQVSVRAGKVTLTGTVGSYSESAEALDDVNAIVGVTSTADKLQVLNPALPFTYSPWVDPFTPHVDSWYVTSPRPALPDTTIAQRINENYSWSPFVLKPDVHVRVENGVAILTGTVADYRERQAAVDGALEAGAVSVQDSLELKHG